MLVNITYGLLLHTPVDLPDYDVDGGSIAFAGSVLHVSKI